ncbi:MAG: hypothetical protein EXS11_00175 [Gemmataceae bacterium]|nr:hypothetical protein [Gemmataceae bacterium]
MLLPSAASSRAKSATSVADVMVLASRIASAVLRAKSISPSTAPPRPLLPLRVKPLARLKPLPLRLKPLVRLKPLARLKPLLLRLKPLRLPSPKPKLLRLKPLKPKPLRSRVNFLRVISTF